MYWIGELYNSYFIHRCLPGVSGPRGRPTPGYCVDFVRLCNRAQQRLKTEDRRPLPSSGTFWLSVCLAGMPHGHWKISMGCLASWVLWEPMGPRGPVGSMGPRGQVGFMPFVIQAINWSEVPFTYLVLSIDVLGLWSKSTFVFVTIHAAMLFEEIATPRGDSTNGGRSDGCTWHLYSVSLDENLRRNSCIILHPKEP